MTRYRPDADRRIPRAVNSLISRWRGTLTLRLPSWLIQTSCSPPCRCSTHPSIRSSRSTSVLFIVQPDAGSRRAARGERYQASAIREPRRANCGMPLETYAPAKMPQRSERMMPTTRWEQERFGRRAEIGSKVESLWLLDGNGIGERSKPTGERTIRLGGQLAPGFAFFLGSRYTNNRSAPVGGLLDVHGDSMANLWLTVKEAA